MTAGTSVGCRSFPASQIRLFTKAAQLLHAANVPPASCTPPSDNTNGKQCTHLASALCTSSVRYAGSPLSVPVPANSCWPAAVPCSGSGCEPTCRAAAAAAAWEPCKSPPLPPPLPPARSSPACESMPAALLLLLGVYFIAWRAGKGRRGAVRASQKASSGRKRRARCRSFSVDCQASLQRAGAPARLQAFGCVLSS